MVRPSILSGKLLGPHICQFVTLAFFFLNGEPFPLRSIVNPEFEQVPGLEMAAVVGTLLQRVRHGEDKISKEGKVDGSKAIGSKSLSQETRFQLRYYRSNAVRHAMMM